jgi:hypothetical protein
MIQQLLIIAAVIGILIFIRWASKQPKQKQFQAIAILVAIIVIGLVITGRAHWLFALFAAIVPVFRRILGMLSYLPVLGNLFTQFRNMQSQSSANKSSAVESVFLNMHLDHVTGIMTGSVKKGIHEGKELEELSVTELVNLYKYYLQQDNDSAQLLEAYLDRKYKDSWRKQIDEEPTHQHSASSTAMTRDEAYSILGIDKDSSNEEIIEAHRKLMQKLHPDRGGSDYLASKINQAKDILLKKAA